MGSEGHLGACHGRMMPYACCGNALSKARALTRTSWARLVGTWGHQTEHRRRLDGGGEEARATPAGEKEDDLSSSTSPAYCTFGAKGQGSFCPLWC